MSDINPDFRREVYKTAQKIDSSFGRTGYSLYNPNPNDLIKQTGPVSCAARAFVLAVALPEIGYEHNEGNIKTTLCYAGGHGKEAPAWMSDSGRDFVGHVWVELTTEEEKKLTINAEYTKGTSTPLIDVTSNSNLDASDIEHADPISGLVAYSGAHADIANLDVDLLQQARADTLAKLSSIGLVAA